MSLSGADWWPELKPWRGESREVSSPTFGLIPGLIYGLNYLGWGPHGRKISDIFPPLGFSSTQGFSPVGTSPTWSLKGEKKLEKVLGERRRKRELGKEKKENVGGRKDAKKVEKVSGIN